MHAEVLHHVIDRLEPSHFIVLDSMPGQESLGIETADDFDGFFDDGS